MCLLLREIGSRHAKHVFLVLSIKVAPGYVEVAQVGGGVTQIFVVAEQGKAVFWGGGQVDDNDEGRDNMLPLPDTHGSVGMQIRSCNGQEGPGELICSMVLAVRVGEKVESGAAPLA
jgi:hypothetical protein